MSQIFQRFPEARPWAWAVGQAVVLLGFHVLLRAAVA